eukprot:3601898-Pyramimonas_sp.AAC.1
MSIMSMWYRLRQAGWSCAISMKDVSNAFGSTKWPSLDSLIQDKVAPQDRNLCMQRYRLSTVEIDTTSGPLMLKTGC